MKENQTRPPLRVDLSNLEPQGPGDKAVTGPASPRREARQSALNFEKAPKPDNAKSKNVSEHDKQSSQSKISRKSKATGTAGEWHCMHPDCRGKFAVSRKSNHKKHDGAEGEFEQCSGEDCVHCQVR